MTTGGIKDWYGKCLVGGRHEPGTEAWRECPLRKAQERSERARKGAVARWSKPGASRKHPDKEQG